MRKFNSILSITVIAVFVLHMAVGGLLLAGVIPYIAILQQSLSGLLAFTAALHTLIGIKLTADTVMAMKRSGAQYAKDNGPFWIRRFSGFAVMLFMILHAVIFMNEKGIPGTFDVIKLICSILLTVSVLLHIVTNIRPLMTGFGKKSSGKAVTVTAFVFSLLLIAAAVAFIVYFVNMSL